MHMGFTVNLPAQRGHHYRRMRTVAKLLLVGPHECGTGPFAPPVRSTYRGYTVGTMHCSGGGLRNTLDELQNLLHVQRLDDLQKVRDKLHFVFACASLAYHMANNVLRRTLADLNQLDSRGKARQGKARQGKARQGKARQGKARARPYRRLHLLLLAAHRHKVLGACHAWAVTSDRPQSLTGTCC
jgi:hypothetical protein